MKQPERFPPDDPREWINRARSNLAIARTLVSKLYFANHILDPTYSLIFQVNPSREPIFIGALLSSVLAQKT